MIRADSIWTMSRHHSGCKINFFKTIVKTLPICILYVNRESALHFSSIPTLVRSLKAATPEWYPGVYLSRAKATISRLRVLGVVVVVVQAPRSIVCCWWRTVQL